MHDEVRSLLGDVKALVAWAKDKGCDFSEDEYTAFVEEHKAQLKVEDLDKVAGDFATDHRWSFSVNRGQGCHRSGG